MITIITLCADVLGNEYGSGEERKYCMYNNHTPKNAVNVFRAI